MITSRTIPDLFHARAVANIVDPRDPDLARGTHLRLHISPDLGFPLHPFVVRQGKPLAAKVTMQWATRTAGPVTGALNLDQVGGAATGTILPISAGQRPWILRCTFTLNPLDAPLTLELVGRDGRVLAWRDQAPWSFAWPDLETYAFRARGKGVVDLADVQCGSDEATTDPVANIGASDMPGLILGLPLEGTLPWYANAPGAAPALSRVERGAPPRLGPHERADEQRPP